MSLSRRQFLTRVGQAGGYSAAFLAMQGLDLAVAEPIRAESVQAAGGSGTGVRVVILGGGIAGMVAAYELRPLGYEVTVLEARNRPGGRNYTVRGGDEVRLMDGSVQRCTWDVGHYQNFGPARLPSIHPNMLGYCKKLGVELQVEVNMSRSAHMQNDKAMNGRPAVMRQVVNDTRGHVSELLMKCMNQGALDAEMTGDDRQRMLDFLRIYGPLDDAGKYGGSDRAGYSKPAGAGAEAGVLSEPIDLHALLQAEFWQGMLFDEQFDMQATMFQPVGGMDRIPYAFAKSLGGVIQFEAAVTALHKTERGVQVEYKQHGVEKKIDADFCICAMPLTKMRGLQTNLEAPYKKVVDECVYAGAYKIAWESRRFWEQEHNVYGGLEFVNVGCSPIWLPSWGFFSERGVLVSGYTDETQTPFEKLTMEQKFAESRKSIERLHPGFGHELEKPMYYGWSKSEWNEGSWISAYGPGQGRHYPPGGGGVYSLNGNHSAGQAPGMKPSTQTGQARSATAARTGTNPGYETLIQPDGRILFAGDHCSHIVGWQEGAALSAIRAVGLINDRVKAARLGAGVGATVA